MEQNTKTPEEIQNLKDSWKHDPIWDIEHTDGFAAHFDELKSYRLSTEKEWELKKHSKLLKKAEDLGISENVPLAKYIISLEEKIDFCLQKIEELKA